MYLPTDGWMDLPANRLGTVRYSTLDFVGFCWFLGMSVRREARVLHGAFLLITLIVHSCDSFVVHPKLTCARNGVYSAVPAGEEEDMEEPKYSKGEVDPGALPYASRVAADFFRAANPFSNKPAPERRVDDAWQGLSPSAQRVLEAYQQTGFGRTSDLWTRQTDEEVVEQDKLIKAEREAGIILPTEQEMMLAAQLESAAGKNLGKPPSEPDIDDSGTEAPESPGAPKGGEI